MIAPVNRGVGLIRQVLVVELKEDPLRPMVVVTVMGRHFTIPVVAEAEAFDLTAEVFDIMLGSHFWVRSRFNRIVFRWKSEGVKTHWMQHVIPIHPQVATVDIGCGIPLGVSDVKTASRWVGEHIQHIEALLFGD